MAQEKVETVAENMARPSGFPRRSPLLVGLGLLQDFTAFDWKKVSEILYKKPETLCQDNKLNRAASPSKDVDTVDEGTPEAICSPAEDESLVLPVLLDDETDKGFLSGADDLTPKCMESWSQPNETASLTHSALLAKFREDEDEFADMDLFFSAKLRTAIYPIVLPTDGDLDDGPSVGESKRGALTQCGSQTMSDADNELFCYQETSDDYSEEHDLACDEFEKPFYKWGADVHESVLTYDEYVSQPVIQQIYADMNEQDDVSSFRSSTDSSQHLIQQAVTWFDGQQYIQWLGKGHTQSGGSIQKSANASEIDYQSSPASTENARGNFVVPVWTEEDLFGMDRVADLPPRPYIRLECSTSSENSLFVPGQHRRDLKLSQFNSSMGNRTPETIHYLNPLALNPVTGHEIVFDYSQHSWSSHGSERIHGSETGSTRVANLSPRPYIRLEASSGSENSLTVPARYLHHSFQFSEFRISGLGSSPTHEHKERVCEIVGEHIYDIDMMLESSNADRPGGLAS
ncbi:hypothetical protein C8035_v002048 [Colletotrichum spinosum]|uniref:Uncharacterized protein n=1 Tax=Colletotrichum spinosum TaxID=1347390 RepID=A0A4R8Q5B6_9PEZI|nr:hypothetical protein C8035_v002048 [Colletotrichum spinosum]